MLPLQRIKSGPFFGKMAGRPYLDSVVVAKPVSLPGEMCRWILCGDHVRMSRCFHGPNANYEGERAVFRIARDGPLPHLARFH